MAKTNMFANAATKRAAEQETIQTVATGEKVDRTTLTLSITVEDKAELKKLAIANGVTVAGLIHQWIASAKNN